MDLKI